jgi:hypothetical protein
MSLTLQNNLSWHAYRRIELNVKELDRLWIMDFYEAEKNIDGQLHEIYT